MMEPTVVLPDFLPDPLVLVSADGIILSANKAFALLLDKARDGLTGQSLLSLSVAGQSQFHDVIAQCSETSAPLSFPLDVRLSKGDIVRCLVQGALVRRGDSTCSTIVWLRLTPDRSAAEESRRETDEPLSENERKLSDFFENASIGLHWVGPDGIIMRANRTELQMLGYSPEEYVGRHIADFHADQSAIEDILARLTRGETLNGYPARLRCKDGSIREVLISSNVLFEEGRFTHTRCFTTDVTDRRKAEEALRLSEARYRDLIHALPAALYTCDAQGRIILYNQRAAILWGREPEIGKDRWCGSWKAYRPEGTPLTLDECAMSLTLREGRAVGGYEMVIERPDGTRRHVRSHPEPLTDAAGVVVGALNMLIDVTDSKQAEDALAKLAAIVTSSDDAIIGKNLDGIITSWNRSAERLFGYTAQEMIGQPVSRLIPRERHNEEPTILQRLRRGEAIEHYETIRCRKDGTRLHISLSVSPVVNAQGRIIGASKIARDITPQKLAEKALVESREELRKALEYQEAVVNNMGEGLYTVDREGLVTSVNQAAERLLGWTQRELLGRSMHEMVHYKHPDGSAFPAEACAGLDVLRGGGPLLNFEDVFIRKDGQFFTVVYSASPIWAAGTVAGLVVVFRDISDRKKSEAVLRERDRALTEANKALTAQSAALAEANKELESFSYSVSHDLRAPLRTIDAFSRIVEEEHRAGLDAEAQRCLAIVRRAAAQAGELIDDLLELSRLGRQSMQMHPVRMTELAKEAADEISRLYPGRTVELVVGDLPLCQGDRRLLKLVWTNLLSNAFKYTKYAADSSIEVGWLPDDSQADASVYYVKDNGVGFDMKYVHKLFGVFQRLHKKEEYEGTGVGLAIVQRIVHRHSGRVWAEGKANGGATFYFSLRKAESSSQRMPDL